MIIYKAENNINGKIYIGKTIYELEFRINAHAFRACQPFGYALKKYGKENFDISVIDTAESEDDLCRKEIYWIAFYKCKCPNGYNLTDGGEGSSGLVHKPETKILISQKAKGRKMPPRSEEYRKRFSEMYKGKPGRPWTESQRAKISAFMASRPVKQSTRDKLSKLLNGRKFRPETIVRMSMARIGWQPSEETRKNMSIAQTGRKLPEEVRAKIAESNRRRVYSDETKKKISEKLKAAWAKKTEEERKAIMENVRNAGTE